MLQRSWRARLAVGIAATAALLGAPGSPAHAAADATPAPPDQDAFYRQGGPVPAVAPGSILASRPVTVAAFGLPLPLSAWQLRYATRDSRDQPEAAVATVILPGDASRNGPRPLVSYQVAEDSLTTTCAPSYEMRLGREGEEPLIGQALTMGWAVVVPDYEGPDSQWTAGTQAGHAVLDGIRAALRFGPAGLAGPSTPLGLWGYSGGAQATAWATELQPGYAPELRIAGAAEGGVPADVEQVARTLDGGFASGLLFGAAVGLSRAYPEMQTDSILNARGRAAFAAIGHECIDQFSREYAFQHLADYTTVADPLALPAVRSVIALDRLGRHIPSAPLHVYQARFDELIPASQVQALVRTYCAAHATVQYQEDLIGEHVTEAVSGAPGAVAYLAGRFNGVAVPATC